DRDVGHGAERTPRSGQQFAEVIAGDILHDATTGLDRFTTAGDGGDAEEMIAGSTGFYASRTGQIGGDCAANRTIVCLRTEQWAVVDRLKSQFLVVLVQ